MGRAWRDQVVELWALIVCSFGHVFRLRPCVRVGVWNLEEEPERPINGVAKAKMVGLLHKQHAMSDRSSHICWRATFELKRT
jgi:hypothetical protein